MIKFEWDVEKNKLNTLKHRVTFKEAASVFMDGFARVIPDPDHSTQEDRFILLGMSIDSKILLVCHCYRENANIIRIVSARKANKREEKQYGGFK